MKKRKPSWRELAHPSSQKMRTLQAHSDRSGAERRLFLFLDPSFDPDLLHPLHVLHGLLVVSMSVRSKLVQPLTGKLATLKTVLMTLLPYARHESTVRAPMNLKRPPTFPALAAVIKIASSTVQPTDRDVPFFSSHAASPTRDQSLPQTQT